MSQSVEAEKKKFYKKWWFWLIVVIVILIIIGMGSDNTETNKVSDGASNSSAVSKSKKEVEVIDFSSMSFEEITNWCTENNIKGNKKEEYSDTIPKDSFVSQSISSGEKVSEGTKIDIIYSLGKEPTVSQQNALKKAKSYLNTLAFSYSGLVKQLEFEKFSNADAVYAVDNCGADWNEQALKKGESYLKTSSFSREGLIGQLKFEGFTQEQATYAADTIYN